MTAEPLALPDPPPEVEDLFDRPARWRGSAILGLGLEGEERIAAASPGAGFPAALRSLADGLALEPGDRVVDLGAGLGGVAEWLRTASGAEVHAVEPAVGSRTMACRLFPHLHVCADVSELGLPDRTVDAVVLAGVLSLVHDADALIEAAARLLRPGGRLGITDVVPLGQEEVIVSELNVLRDVPVLTDHLASSGFVVTHVGHGPAAPAPEWQAIAAAVHDRVAEAHRGAEELRLVEEDRRHLARLRHEHGLASVTLVATRAAVA